MKNERNKWPNCPECHKKFVHFVQSYNHMYRLDRFIEVLDAVSLDAVSLDAVSLIRTQGWNYSMC